MKNMAKTKVESTREAKVNLGDLTGIPPKEFEQHFRDWMERDDVARSLQAKLRTDLIANFNKTALGKHIIAQTTTTTGGGATQRLTLCPLTLALNTLVAEFLYAGNCHFTLSVFCTEVPYRNTLPDFESMRRFRFNENEIAEIVRAVTGDLTNAEANMATDITRKYVAESGGSLLLLIVQVLLRRIKSQFKSCQTQTHLQSQAQGQAHPQPQSQPQLQHVLVSNPSQPKSKSAETKNTTQHDFKTEVYNSNFRYLNKYLIILSKKVHEMTQQFRSLQHKSQRGATTRSTRVFKTPQTRKFENLNRSLERITENLKLMSHAKRRSKRVGAIVSAIEGLALQFTKCAANFENVSRGLSGRGECCSAALDAGRTRVGRAEKHTETEMAMGAREEKSYLDWVQEMRHTSNGQKFLDRIEAALRKALGKQREQLTNETDMKLRHQKELIKIRYKQKLMDELSKHGHSSETRLRNEDIERKLQQFEHKHFQLLHKNNNTEAQFTTLPSHDSTLAAPKATATTTAPAPAIVSVTAYAAPKLPMLKDAVNTQKQLQQIVANMSAQERNVDHIVYDAKLRIQELENESTQLEQSFLNYLERQRVAKEATSKAAAKAWDYYATERDRMWQRFNNANSNIIGAPNATAAKSDDNDDVDDGDFLLVQKRLQRASTPPNPEVRLPNTDATDTSSRNAIREAKVTFFANKQRHMELVERQFDLDIVADNDGDRGRQLELSELTLIDNAATTLRTCAAVQPAPAAQPITTTKTKTTTNPVPPQPRPMRDDAPARLPSSSSSGLVLRQSMAKMQMLFDGDGDGDVNGNENTSADDGGDGDRAGIRPTLEPHAAQSQLLLPTKTAPQQMPKVNIIPTVPSATPSITLANAITTAATTTTTSTTSTERVYQSMLAVAGAPSAIVIDEVDDLRLGHNDSSDSSDSGSDSAQDTAGGTSLEVEALLHAPPVETNAITTPTALEAVRAMVDVQVPPTHMNTPPEPPEPAVSDERRMDALTGFMPIEVAPFGKTTPPSSTSASIASAEASSSELLQLSH